MAEAEEDCHSDAVRAGDDEDESPAGSDLQTQLQMFRAQWMFELAPGVGASSLETQPCRAARGAPLKAVADTKGKQELAKEEKARELFLKAVEEEQNGALYEGTPPLVDAGHPPALRAPTPSPAEDFPSGASFSVF
ncbi:F-box only protein 9-like [Perognathus longimembris pacificus]|uniref:F-box only protein 9-like n=1 Tax=Perognathus longimembris pacificus TaxID=214514 RepID=UPI0020193A3F|nr:F-box only protein 9-like [Perognathus longimembris pacificus]XP_048193398.1 F-box only protein 9-like [Perognathus longimembris pacificus]